ncbi:DNA-binding protein YbiB [Oxalobacteraceae bacterium CAVE-383]|nr:DNA-binding protein YbiB [Oxalobacteraceae bacterium CAVE-383]
MENIDTSKDASAPLAAARFIKEIGRGKDGARSLSREDAQLLYSAMLERRVSDLELGAILLAMRVKGESVEEISGFLQAAEASFPALEAPAGNYAPIVIPSYNGSRRVANLTPLLALLLAREGAPVLVHGVTQDPGRVTTYEIFQALGCPPAQDAAGAMACFQAGRPAFMAIAALAPKMAGLLAMRRILGVRNSTHTLVKIIQPFARPALRLTSYTHPEYFAMLGDYFRREPSRGDAFLMRGTEGETVANARRAQQIDWFHQGVHTQLVEKQGTVEELPDLPAQNDAACTASWIQAVLNGKIPVPAPIADQVRHCLTVARALDAA